MIALDPQDLHDAGLSQVLVLWDVGKATLEFKLSRAVVPGASHAILACFDTSMLVFPRRKPWGDSDQVNTMSAEQRANGAALIQIELQSGDVVVIECGRFELQVSNSSSSPFVPGPPL